MQVVIRQATKEDIPALHRVRRAVRENALRSDVIREEHYLPEIETTGRGWVAEEDGAIVAFAVGNAQTGNIWALFVHPDHEGRGHGKALQDEMIDWLFAQGLNKLHLSTAPGTRAQKFYAASGWTFMGIDRHGDAAFEREAPHSA